jgi:hypothetical protein
MQYTSIPDIFNIHCGSVRRFNFIIIYYLRSNNKSTQTTNRFVFLESIMNSQYTHYTLLPQDVANLDALAEKQAIENFRDSIRKTRTTYNSFVGQDGNGQELSWSTRRRIASALRQSCRVLGMGQKSRIGRLGGGAAIGAIIAGFATPAMAQYAAGSGVNTGPGGVPLANEIAISGNAPAGTPEAETNSNAAIAIGSSSLVGLSSRAAIAIGYDATVSNNSVNAIAIGELAVATGTQAIAMGTGNTVNSFSTAGTATVNQIFDRAAGGNFTFPVICRWYR